MEVISGSCSDYTVEVPSVLSPRGLNIFCDALFPELVLQLRDDFGNACIGRPCTVTLGFPLAIKLSGSSGGSKAQLREAVC
jgi:hypothetical protein